MRRIAYAVVALVTIAWGLATLVAAIPAHLSYESYCPCCVECRPDPLVDALVGVLILAVPIAGLAVTAIAAVSSVRRGRRDRNLRHFLCAAYTAVCGFMIPL